MKRLVAVGDSIEVRITAIKPEIKNVIVVLGDDLAITGLRFGMLRGSLRIDPLVLVRVSLLHAEVRAVDATQITLAITDSHAVA